MPRPPRLPQVLLLIETSRAYGRGLVEGIARYAEEHGPWSIYFDERGLRDPLPRWLKNWHGDGIISRTTHKLDMLMGVRLPVVELFSPALNMPLVRPGGRDDRPIGRRAFSRPRAEQSGLLLHGPGPLGRLAKRGFPASLARAWLSVPYFPHRGWATPRRQKSTPHRRSPGDPLAPGTSPTVWHILCHRLPRHAVDSELPELRPAGAGANCRARRGQRPGDLRGLFSASLQHRVGQRGIGYEAAALLDRMMAGQSPPHEGVCVEPVQVITRQSTDTLAIEDPDMAQAARLIRQQACRRLRVAQVADALGLSRRVFEQRFRAALQRNPKEEIVRVQMERAKMLLSGTIMPVSLVAKESGFTSLAYFSRAFRRQIGLTPRAYRKRHHLSGGSPP